VFGSNERGVVLDVLALAFGKTRKAMPNNELRVVAGSAVVETAATRARSGSPGFDLRIRYRLSVALRRKLISYATVREPVSSHAGHRLIWARNSRMIASASSMLTPATTVEARRVAMSGFIAATVARRRRSSSGRTQSPLAAGRNTFRRSRV